MAAKMMKIRLKCNKNARKSLKSSKEHYTKPQKSRILPRLFRVSLFLALVQPVCRSFDYRRAVEADFFLSNGSKDA